MESSKHFLEPYEVFIQKKFLLDKNKCKQKEYYLDDLWFLNDKIFECLVIKYIISLSEKGYFLLKEMALNDTDNLTRASAIDIISQYGPFPKLWEQTLKDSSYFVISNTIYSLINVYGAEALDKVEPFEDIEERHVVYALGEYYSVYGIENKYDWFEKNLNRISGSEMSYFLNHFTQYLINQPKETQKKGIEYLVYQAKTNSFVQTRKDAYQSLTVLKNAFEEELKLELEIEQKLDTIRNEEKDRRVAEFQQALGF